jgi:hypothetical protein
MDHELWRRVLTTFEAGHHTVVNGEQPPGCTRNELHAAGQALSRRGSRQRATSGHKPVVGEERKHGCVNREGGGRRYREARLASRQRARAASLRRAADSVAPPAAITATRVSSCENDAPAREGSRGLGLTPVRRPMSKRLWFRTKRRSAPPSS